MHHPTSSYPIKRFDLSTNTSLKAWSAADEYLLQHVTDLDNPPKHMSIYHDRFGFLACHLQAFHPTVITIQKSQEKAIKANLELNGISLSNFSNPLSSLDNKIDLALIKNPKSLALFQLYLEHLIHHSTEDLTVFSAFMTRHFTPKLLKIAGEYFEEVKQSKAKKKARVMILTQKKHVIRKEIIDTIVYKSRVYQQYWGVFSGGHIDYATQYFLEHMQIRQTDHCILDVGSGNGIIANEIAIQLPDAEIHLLDDSCLAVASAKLNITGAHIYHHFNNDLSIFDDHTFDLIVTNPPFHFEHEINIDTPIQLFKECLRCLKKGGSLQLVANHHLNYKVHLEKLFSSVQVIAQNDKYVIYRCIKTR